MEKEYWQQFTATGKVEDYLHYKSSDFDKRTGKDCRIRQRLQTSEQSFGGGGQSVFLWGIHHV